MKDLSNNLYVKLCVGVLATLGLVGVGAATSFATTVPPAETLGGYFAGSTDGVVTFVVTTAVPVVLGAIVIGILIRKLFRWTRKAGAAIG